MTADPATYDYSRPTRNCDVVMKGGITSGVVYPHAVCELAQTYRLRNVGGTSAGAIAAAAAAAAELGRDADGFRKLASLPAWISAGDNLFSLFQPQRSTRRLFRFLISGLGTPRGRAVRLLVAGVLNFPLAVLAGAAAGAALVALSAVYAESAVMLVAGIAGGVLLLCIGAVLGLLAGVLRTLGRSVPANGFGLCSGLASGTRPALTPWLSGVLDDLAGRTQADDPLTFGDLDAAGIRLELMTTNLTNRRPHKLPWDTREFFFDPDELRSLFPERIVEWMEKRPPPAPDTPADRRDWELRCALLSPLLPLPAKDDLPVIVATRMSLSFPILLSALPLWSIDASRTRNQAALEAWRRWAREHPDEPPGDDAPTERPQAERCWFSDGGISSNFPVHFFDSPLPRRPTFAINLRPFHPDHPRSQDERENVYLPAGSGGGLLEWWYRFPERGGLASVSAFAQSVVRTMQNRVDEAQMRVPGYRDRVVHVSFTKDEGGMNLTMPPELIVALTARGRHAAAALVDRFANPPAAPGDLSWDSHRWTRFRSALAALAELTTLFDEGYSTPPEQAGDRTYAELSARTETEHPRAYQWLRRAQRQLGEDLVAEMNSAAQVQAAASPTTLEEGAPRPRPEVRLAPRD
jgi:predicted acylesterase/phospholipase RssA